VPILKEIMTGDVFTTSRSATVSEVAEAMLKGRFGSALVVEGATLMGIVTERDILRAVAAHVDTTVAKVADWMTADPVTAAPDMDASEAAEIMMSQGFRHLPVVEGSAVTGIVSLRDILRTRVRRAPS
jgi:CBS domain-containing protein